MKHLIILIFLLPTLLSKAQLQLKSVLHYGRDDDGFSVNRDSIVYTHSSTAFAMADNMPELFNSNYIPLIWLPGGKEFSFLQQDRYLWSSSSATFNLANTIVRTSDFTGKPLADIPTALTELKIVHNYDANGNEIVLKKFINLGSNEWQIMDSVVSTYTATNKLFTRNSYQNVGSSLFLFYQDSVIYDANDRWIQFTQHATDYGQVSLFLHAKNNAFYSGSELISIDCHRNNMSNLFEQTYRQTYQYAGGLLIATNGYEYINGVINPTPVSTSAFMYDSNSNIIQINNNDYGDYYSYYLNYFIPNFVSSITRDGTNATLHSKYEYVSSEASIDEVQTSVITTYPNPTKDMFNISLNEITEIAVYNEKGEIVLTQIGNNQQINLSEFATGIYNLKIQTKQQTFKTSIVKE
jgi:Secretion system C-terminal sorting domain